MAQHAYKNFYISVFHIPDQRTDASYITLVEIRHKQAQDLTVRFKRNLSCQTSREASAKGMALGKHWVDTYGVEDAGPAQGKTPSQEGLLAKYRRLGLRTWLLSFRVF